MATSVNKLSLVGPLGSLNLPFLGTDVICKTKNSYFFFSKNAYSTFINLLSKQLAYLASGVLLELTLVGLGFRVLKLNQVVLLKVGHAHYIKVVIPPYLYVIAYKKKVLLFGVSYGLVKQFACSLVSFRKPDVYKNKGIQLVGQSFRVKLGKQK